MQLILFLLVLCFAIVANIFFTRPRRSDYYCAVGVLVLFYTAAKAFLTFVDGKQTLTSMIVGLAMASIPLLIWGVPSAIRLPWMTEVVRSDGKEA